MLAAVEPRGPVGLVVTWLDTDYWLRLAAGATDAFRSHGYVPICFTLGRQWDPEPHTPHPFFDLIGPECVSGIVVAASAAFQTDAATFIRSRGDLPAVCVGQRVPDIPSVWTRNSDGIRLLMKHLTETRGRKRVAFIRGTANNPEAEARFHAWEDFCAASSLPHGAELVEQGEFTQASGEAATLRLLAKSGAVHPDAILASNDPMAIGALRALRARGFLVPDDISVVGFDDLEAKNADPPLTTARQPVYEMAVRSAEMLVADLRGDRRERECMFSPELVVRASCAPTSVPWGRNFFASAKGGTFWEPSHAPLDRVVSALWQELAMTMDARPSRGGRIGELVARLGDELELARAHEGALLETVKRSRSWGARRLTEALARAESVDQLQGPLQELTPLLGIESLTVATTVSASEGFAGRAKLVVDCVPPGGTPLAAQGDVLPGRQIVALHARRPASALRVALPLLGEGRAFGFLLVSGAVLDAAVLHDLTSVLARVVMRVRRR
jgi:DNA-binding LacI/PurR family transcriptional regulator